MAVSLPLPDDEKLYKLERIVKEGSFLRRSTFSSPPGK
jgi:hypothetical protein